MNYLADTSIWIDHLNNKNDELSLLLKENRVYIHPFIIGEIACGNLSNRDEILHLLNQLPMAESVTHEEALLFLTRNKLYGKGIGWIDVHLLAACALSNLKLITLDKRLQKAADEPG